MESQKNFPLFMKRGENVKKIKNRFDKLFYKFDESFNIEEKVEEKNTPMLLEVFDRFAEEIYRPSINYKKNMYETIKIDKMLRSTLNSNQIKLLEERENLKNKMHIEENEQAFVYGFAMASQMREEAIKKYPYKK